ncbi:MAG: aromatic amino acid lyase, partial [Pseudomonadota bacterium]
MNLHLGERPLTLAELRAIAAGDAALSLHASAAARVAASSAVVQRIAGGDIAVYGVNTGIGKLASTRIPREQLAKLQRNIILSHAVGVGEFLDAAVVRLILALKIASFAQGFSGVRPVVVDALLECYHRGLLPCIPAKGSVGASGDLAPLAHMTAVLMGEGEADFDGRRLAAPEALKAAGMAPITLGPKEGVALINGTQVST